MNNILLLQKELGVRKEQIESVLKLLSEGSTIPFIARYRKEVTGNLDEEQIRVIEKEYNYLENLSKRKDDIIRLISEKGLMNEQLLNSINECTKLAELEDIYRPYKEKKKTKATDAIAKGLEPLAKKMMAFPLNGDINSLAKPYLDDIDESITGALYIIAEWISDNAYYRKVIKQEIWNNGFITSKIKKDAVDEDNVFKMYYDFQERIKYAKHFHLLALNRGEDKKILTVKLDYDLDKISEFLKKKIIKNNNSFVVSYIEKAINDSLKRLILPSVEREIMSDALDKAMDKAIETFQDNLEHLLMTKPIKGKVVMGFDPAFRTGCKLAVLSSFGDVLDIATIYPNEPHNEIEKSREVLLSLINKYHVDIIAIGNGTASRESEKFVAESIKGLPVLYNLVSEAGASVYSASPLAIEEFPNLTVEKRSAISIGRRIEDPLSELVKIDPKSIGVGEYQHDVKPKELSEALSFTVSKIVNEIGVNINTASKSILGYISGLSKKTIDGILKYREHGVFKNREELKNIPGFSDKVYEQAIGFLRIVDGSNPLDRTRIHPEIYKTVENILTDYHLTSNDIGSDKLKEAFKDIDYSKLSKKYDLGESTLKDVINELVTPGVDYRDKLDDVILKSDVLTLEDLKIGMELTGTVRNVTSFGAFVDIGLHDDGLVHISHMSKSFVSDPKEIVSVGDIVKVYVISIEDKRVGLSLIKEVI